MQFVSLLANIILETIKDSNFLNWNWTVKSCPVVYYRGPINFLEQLPRKLMLLYLSVYIYYRLYFIYFFRRTRGVTIKKFETTISLKQTKHQHLCNVRRTLIEETVKCKVMTITVFFLNYFLIEQP